MISAGTLVLMEKDTSKLYVALVTVKRITVDFLCGTCEGQWSVYINEGEMYNPDVQTESLLVTGSDNCCGSNSLILAETAECSSFL